MDEKYKSSIYSIGFQWAKNNLPQIEEITNSYSEFQSWLQAVMNQESFPAEEVFLPVRIYNQYKRYTDEAQHEFIAGAWGFLNSQ